MSETITFTYTYSPGSPISTQEQQLEWEEALSPTEEKAFLQARKLRRPLTAVPELQQVQQRALAGIKQHLLAQVGKEQQSQPLHIQITFPEDYLNEYLPHDYAVLTLIELFDQSFGDYSQVKEYIDNARWEYARDNQGESLEQLARQMSLKLGLRNFR